MPPPRHSMLRLFCLLALLIVTVFTSEAVTPPTLPITGERVALVIGNAAYQQLPALGNSSNDARAIGHLLGQAGFDVDLVLDGDIRNIRAAVKRLQQRMQDGKVRSVVFYYAGHAVQLEWRNFLVAVDAHIKRIDDVPDTSLNVADVLNAFGAANTNRDKQFVVILDSCRNSPFPPNISLAKKGLSQFDAPPNTLVAFSTAPGQVAYDGDQDHSFYTAMLLREMAVPDISIEDMLKRVRMGVRVASLGRQIPWESTSLERKFYLFPPRTTTSDEDISHVEQSMREELDQWIEIKKHTTIEALVGFLQRFPNGNLNQLAQHLLDDLLFQRAQTEAGLIAQRMRNLENPEGESSAATAAPTNTDASANSPAPSENTAATPAVSARPDESPAPTPTATVAQASVSSSAPTAQPEPSANANANANAQNTPPTASTSTAPTPSSAPPPEPPTPRPVDTAVAAAPQTAAPPRTKHTASTAPSLDLGPTPLEKELLATTQQLGLSPVAPVAVLAKQAPLPAEIPPSQDFAGAEPLNRRFHVGDLWHYAINNRARGEQSIKELRVTRVDTPKDRIEYNSGEFASDLMGNATNTDRGTLDYPRQFYPATLQVGASWISSFTQDRGSNGHYTFRYDLRVVRKEKIRVPAGEFDAYRIEANGRNLQLGHTIQRVIWVVPGINANIAVDVVVRAPNGSLEDNYRWELKDYTPARPG